LEVEASHEPPTGAPTCLPAHRQAFLSARAAALGPGRHEWLRSLFAGLLLCVGALPAQAVAIAGGNGSFETNTASNPGFAGINGLWTLDSITVSGWTFSTGTGDGRWFMQGNNGGNNFGAPADPPFTGWKAWWCSRTAT
jgi:hypothetical protein